MGEADDRLQHCQQPRVVDAQPGNPAAAGRDAGLTQLLQLATIHKGGEHVLLNAQVALVGRAQSLAEFRQVVNVLGQGEVFELISGRLGA